MATYKLISSYTVGAGGVNQIDFTSIPQTYTDLLLVWSLRTSQGGGVINVQVRANGVSTTTYRNKMMRSYNNSTSSAQGTELYWEYNYAQPSSATANAFASSQYYFNDYTNANQKKSGNSVGVLIDTGSSNTHLNWNSNSNHTITDPITSLSIRNGNTITDTYVQHSSAYLYGISNA